MYCPKESNEVLLSLGKQEVVFSERYQWICIVPTKAMKLYYPEESNEVVLSLGKQWSCNVPGKAMKVYWP